MDAIANLFSTMIMQRIVIGVCVGIVAGILIANLYYRKTIRHSTVGLILLTAIGIYIVVSAFILGCAHRSLLQYDTLHIIRDDGAMESPSAESRAYVISLLKQARVLSDGRQYTSSGDNTSHPTIRLGFGSSSETWVTIRVILFVPNKEQRTIGVVYLELSEYGFMPIGNIYVEGVILK